MLARRTRLAAIALGLAALAASAVAAGPREGDVPINTVIESGQDVGPCEGGARLEYAPTPLKGIAYFLVNNGGALREPHRAIAARESLWVQELLGPSPQNRVYVDAAGARALVFEVCKQGDCGDNRLVGAAMLAGGKGYGLVVTEAGRTRELGTFAAPMRAALACVRRYDERDRAAAAEALRRPAGK